jgi:hypothetical protein
VAVDGTDQGTRKAVRAAEEAVDPADHRALLFGVEGRGDLEVHARGEEAVAPGDDDGSGFGAAELFERFRPLLEQLEVQRVGRRPVYSDQRYLAALLDRQVAEHGRRLYAQ